jgi:hypothetical protein
MKKRILSLLGILLAFLFILSSCGKTEIEQSQEDYNYDKIIPVVLNGIQGSATAIKTNTKTYSLNYFRGGSTWEWTAVGAQVVPIEGSNGNEVNIFFDQDSLELNGPVTITVVETTMGGVKSEPATKEVKVSPFKIIVSGPSEAVASGAWTSRFSTPHDAGATYAWSVIGAGAALTDNNNGTADVLWDLSATDIADVGIRCVKTFVGLQSIADTALIDLAGYVAKTRDDFIGTFSGDESGGGTTTFTTVAGTEADELVFEVDGVTGLPALYVPIFTGWGEYFVAGYGNDGNIIVTMDMTSGAVTIETQDWGVTNWGEGEDPVYHYMISGTGWWNGQDMTFHLVYDFRGSTGGLWYRWNGVFTKQ